MRWGVGRALHCGGKVAGKLLPEPGALEAPPRTPLTQFLAEKLVTIIPNFSPDKIF